MLRNWDICCLRYTLVVTSLDFWHWLMLQWLDVSELDDLLILVCSSSEMSENRCIEQYIWIVCLHHTTKSIFSAWLTAVKSEKSKEKESIYHITCIVQRNYNKKFTTKPHLTHRSINHRKRKKIKAIHSGPQSRKALATKPSNSITTQQLSVLKRLHKQTIESSKFRRLQSCRKLQFLSLSASSSIIDPGGKRQCM